MKHQHMEFHPIADIFPMMQGEEYEFFKANIEANGLHDPIWTYEGMILDGRNRYRACQELNIETKFREWNGEGGTPVSFIISSNLARRHLNESQRSLVAARLANMQREDTLKHGSRPANLPDGAVSQPQAAEMLNVGERSVRDAKKVLTDGVPELIELVDSGHLAVSQAASLVKTPKKTQRKVAKKISSGIKPTEARRQVIAESYDNDPELPPGKYRVIYADPPWQYGNTSIDQLGEQRDHYKTKTLDEITSMPVKNLAEDNAVLFVWATSPILEDSFKVIHAWGFEYKASFVWDKVKHVMGHYNSVRHEFLLVCTRGSCLPDVKRLHDSVLTIERTGQHGEKPKEFRAIIDEIYPNGKRIELFSRHKAKGWDYYGNELIEE